MKCKLVDVFSDQKYSGNGLGIFYDFENLSVLQMQNLTRELRQFESIFLTQKDNEFSARIFTAEEELDFAGHPLLGLAFHLHEAFGTTNSHIWEVRLNRKKVRLESRIINNKFVATMRQGAPSFLKTLSKKQAAIFYQALNLEPDTSCPSPVQVVTTGLPYLILPVTRGIEDIRFMVEDFTPMLAQHGAKFIYVLDIQSFEGRSWDNCGKVEDIATGSAAGPAAAYLLKHGITKHHEFEIHQGRFLHRPSRIGIRLSGDPENITDIEVFGNVVKVADIHFT